MTAVDLVFGPYGPVFATYSFNICNWIFHLISGKPFAWHSLTSSYTPILSYLTVPSSQAYFYIPINIPSSCSILFWPDPLYPVSTSGQLRGLQSANVVELGNFSFLPGFVCRGYTGIPQTGSSQLLHVGAGIKFVFVLCLLELKMLVCYYFASIRSLLLYAPFGMFSQYQWHHLLIWCMRNITPEGSEARVVGTYTR